MLLPALLLSALMITSSSCQKEQELIPAVHSTTLYQEDHPLPITDQLDELTEEEETSASYIQQASPVLLETFSCYIPQEEQETKVSLDK